MKTAIGAFLLGMLLVFAVLYGADQRARGAAEARHWKARADSLEARVARIDTVIVVQRDTFLVRRARVDTMTVTVESWKHDTVKVVEYVTAADSAIRACSALVLSCDQRDSVRVLQLEAWEGRWASRPRPPSALRTWAERLAIGFGSYKLGEAVGRATRP